MKRKIKYAILSALLLAVIYFGLRWIFGFFTPYNTLTAVQDIDNGKIQIIAVGLPYMPQIEQRVANKYGFTFKYLGCNATTELLNGTKYYNCKVYKFLEDKFGSSFWKDFDSEVDSLIRIEQKK